MRPIPCAGVKLTTPVPFSCIGLFEPRGKLEEGSGAHTGRHFSEWSKVGMKLGSYSYVILSTA